MPDGLPVFVAALLCGCVLVSAVGYHHLFKVPRLLLEESEVAVASEGKLEKRHAVDMAMQATAEHHLHTNLGMR